MFNFGLNEEQVMLQSTVRRYMEKECTTEFVREMMEDANGYSPKMWQDVADMGLLGVNISEVDAGSGMGLVELMVVMEQMGRALFPGALLETMMVAEAINEWGNGDQKKLYLPKIANGELIGTLAIDEPEGFWDAEAVQATGKREGDRYRLSGTKFFVPYANVADLMVCAVRTSKGSRAEEGVTLLLVEPKKDGVKVETLPTMDESYKLCEVCLDGVAISASQILGEEGAGWQIWDKVRQKATVLASAEMVGGAERVMEMIVAYSKERQQFDKLIGSFQAIKHRCVDMLVDVVNSRGCVYYAAWAVENQAKDAEIAVSSAKAYASDAYVNAAQKALQSFGGIGFTWEHDIHLFMKRARRLEMTFGDATFHRELMASLWL
ncbi:MAG: acyl-CoA/acyl-ACP dehydrogenase [Deltaproteobacteria bacterium]|nr:acyl-CoA/acyl-ACP dehydrogenase [Deltaproteobacteria bacterium]